MFKRRSQHVLKTSHISDVPGLKIQSVSLLYVLLHGTDKLLFEMS